MPCKGKGKSPKGHGGMKRNRHQGMQNKDERTLVRKALKKD